MAVKPTHGTYFARTARLPCRRRSIMSARSRAPLADSALILEVLAGFDADDRDTRPVAAPMFLDIVAEEPPLPPQFAFVRTPVWDKAEPKRALRSRLWPRGSAIASKPIDLPRAFRRSVGRSARHHGCRHGA